MALASPDPIKHQTKRLPASLPAGGLSICLLFAAGCTAGSLLYSLARPGFLNSTTPPEQHTAAIPSAPPARAGIMPFAMKAPSTPPTELGEPIAAHTMLDPLVTGSVQAVLPLRPSMPEEPAARPTPAAPAIRESQMPAAAPVPEVAAAVAMVSEPLAAVAAPLAETPPPAPEPVAAAPVQPEAIPAEAPPVAVAPPVPAEVPVQRTPVELCADLAAIGMHGAEWKRDPGAGEWSCTPEVERFGRDGASLFATILGIDAETVGMVRLKLNLISETVNDTIKQRTVTLVKSLSSGLGLVLPPEAEAALAEAHAYQFSDKNWQFSIRPQENDPARVNIFLRRVAQKEIGMRGGL